MTKLFTRIALALLAISSAPICCASVQIGAVDSGWYKNDGSNAAASPNYWVHANSAFNYRNYFVFDLSGITNTILSAKLRLENPRLTNNGVASTYTLYDVSSSITSLVAGQTNATGIYADLGTGVTYGSVPISSTVGVGVIEITLNAAAISAMNSISGLFAIGGALTAAGSTSAQLFGFTSGPEYERTLVLEVEQPATNVVPEPVSAIVWTAMAVAGSLGVLVKRNIA